MFLVLMLYPQMVASLEGDNLVLTGQTAIGEVRRTLMFTDGGMVMVSRTLI